MAKREPTIEQNSHFTAKTKDGQDVEFEASLKFYITPSGQVILSAPGGQQSSASATAVASSAQEGSQASGQESQQRNTGRKEVDQSSSGTRIQPKRTPSSESIDKAFPRGPEESNECTIKQFIPDPCKAVDDVVKSMKGLYNNFFSGPKCPPPENTDNLYAEYPLFKTYAKDSSEKPVDIGENEDNKNRDMMENEQNYDKDEIESEQKYNKDMMENEQKYDM